MKLLRSPLRILSMLFALTAMLSSCSKGPSQYVNPFVGTAATGHTFPGATTPFGMVQLSPDTRIDGSWEGCSGYHYSDNLIYGFSHTHLSGTGVSDYGDILLMPQIGEPSFAPEEYASTFDHANEKAEPGFYSVRFDNGIEAKLTTTSRVGLHHYSFPKGNASVLLDLQHRDHLIDGTITVVDESTLSVKRVSSAWAREQHTYAHIVISEPCKFEFNEDSTKVLMHFSEETNSVSIKVGLSFTGTEGAKKNLDNELDHWDFDKVRSQATEAWNQVLNKIEVNDGDEEKLKTFYTALYHVMIHPNIAMDVDGMYRGMDGQLHKAEGFDYYTVFSLWDTFRATHPLFTIMDRKRTLDFIQTFLKMYEQGGRLPVWELCSNETDCMIGYHSVSVIADALAKGIDRFDQELALEAMVKSATWDHLGLPAYRRSGFLSVDDEHESVSKTLEYAYDDWCIAQVALRLGQEETYDRFMRRSNAWRNLLDPSTDLMRPRVNGGWLDPFEPREVNNHFTEGNSWQYSFFVPHDVEGLIQSVGGAKRFESVLDGLFSAETDTKGRTQPDITGMIGQYAHGNEPSHHMAYLYIYIDRPEKTEQRVHQILSDFYTSQPDGLIGNEDCGQMSAWYVMSSLGIYAVAPGRAEYAITEPFLDDFTVHLENNRTFTIADIEAAKEQGPFVSHFDLTGEGEAPTTEAPSEVIYVQPPVIQGKSMSFNDSIEVSFLVPEGTRLRYTIVQDGHIIDEYSDPFKTFYKTTNIRAQTELLVDDSIHKSAPVEAKFVKHPHPDWNVQLKSTYNPQYNAGGPEGLIDGILGDRNWRKGYWQGYQGQDFEAIIDMQEVKKVKSVGSSYLQDTRSWIIFPTRISHAFSLDGETWEEMYPVANGTPAQTEDVQLTRFTKSLWPLKEARFVKITATNYGTLPEWHQGHGGEAFIFIDEIEIETR